MGRRTPDHAATIPSPPGLPATALLGWRPQVLPVLSALGVWGRPASACFLFPQHLQGQVPLARAPVAQAARVPLGQGEWGPGLQDGHGAGAHLPGLRPSLPGSVTSSLSSCKTWWITSMMTTSNPRRTQATAAIGRAVPAMAAASTPGEGAKDWAGLWRLGRACRGRGWAE